MSKKMIAALLCAGLAVPANAQQDFGSAFPALSNAGASRVVSASANTVQQPANSNNTTGGQAATANSGPGPRPGINSDSGTNTGAGTGLAPESGFPGFPGAAGFAASSSVNAGGDSQPTTFPNPGLSLQEMANQAKQGLNQQAQSINQQANAVRANAQQAMNQQVQSLNQRGNAMQNQAQQAVNQQVTDAQSLAQQKLAALGGFASPTGAPSATVGAAETSNAGPSANSATSAGMASAGMAAGGMSSSNFGNGSAMPNSVGVANATSDDATVAQMETTIRELEAAHANTYNTLGALLDKVPAESRPALQQAMDTARQGYEKAKSGRERLAAHRMTRHQNLANSSSYGQSGPMVQPTSSQSPPGQSNANQGFNSQGYPGQSQFGQSQSRPTQQPGQNQPGFGRGNSGQSNGVPGRMASGSTQPNITSAQYGTSGNNGNAAFGTMSNGNRPNSAPQVNSSQPGGQFVEPSPVTANPNGFGQGFSGGYGSPSGQGASAGQASAAGQGAPAGNSSMNNGRPRR